MGSTAARSDSEALGAGAAARATWAANNAVAERPIRASTAYPILLCPLTMFDSLFELANVHEPMAAPARGFRPSSDFEHAHHPVVLVIEDMTVEHPFSWIVVEVDRN